jgi:hypothetical protein
MTLTSALWIALAAAVATTAVRALRTPPSREDEEWRPHVTSGCGR